LAYSEVRDMEGLDDSVRRRYPYQQAAHLVGYYSPRYGVGGCEAVFDATLRGRSTQLEQLLHRPQAGGDVTLSASLSALSAADRGLADHRGAVIVLDITTGQVLALVSRPSYDANQLDDEWDKLISDPAAPLLNRATQGVYPVGDLARWVGLAGLMSSGATSPPDPLSVPLEDLLAPLSRMGYLATARQLGFDRVPPIDLPSSAGRLPDFGGKATARDLAVTPLHMVRFMAAVAGDGHMPVPTLAKTGYSGRLAGSAGESAAEPVFAESVSVSLRAVTPHYGDVAGWAGVAQPMETGNEPLSWFVGYAPVREPRFAVVVAIEGSGDGAAVTLPVAQGVLVALQR
jgi:peptidoglycan glycosyltransferase